LEHIRFLTGVIVRVYLPVSIWSLWLLVRKRVGMFLWLIFLISEKNTHDPLLREACEENLLMYGNNEPCWLRCIHILLKHLNMDHMLTHPEIENEVHLLRF
jgi:hypothetical protein